MNPRRILLALTAFLLALPPPVQAAAKFTVLHNFGYPGWYCQPQGPCDGKIPYGPLTLDSKGNLYGVTIDGGDGCQVYGCGTVFRLSPKAGGKWKETILYNFPFSSPWGGLVVNASGDIYGTGTVESYTGGVFELSPSSGGYGYSVLYSGGDAGPGLLMDDLGNLYGEMGPGQYQGGAIGELSPGSDGWTYTALHSFDGYDGLYPEAPPTWDGKGNMFGTTMAGGIYKSPCGTTLGCGVIYEMTPNGDGSWTYHVLHRFASFKDDGQNPYSGLALDKAGNFYGVTWLGGANGQGTVYKLAYVGGHWRETILYDFPNCADGCMVEGTLALDKAGNLYGTAAGGTGSCGGWACGVVFKLSPQKNGQWKYSVVYDFTPEGGGLQPFYGVILDGKGNLFGVTSQFGKYGGGTAFEIIQ